MTRSSLLPKLLVALLAVTPACTESGFVVPNRGGDSQGSGGDEVDEKPIPDGERPSDVGEGVPGYLVDPERVTFTTSNGTLTVSGPPGSIASLDGKPRSAVVTVLGVTAEDFSGEPPATFEAVPRGSVTAGADGAFAVDVTIGARDSVLLRLGGKTDDRRVPVQDGRDVDDGRIVVVYKNPADSTPARALDSRLWRALATPAATVSGFADVAACNGAGFFWSVVGGVCDEGRRLASLRHCWPSPDLTALIELIDERDFDGGDEVKDKLENRQEQGYRLDQCYFAGTVPETIIIHLLKDGEPSPDESQIGVAALPLEGDLSE